MSTDLHKGMENARDLLFSLEVAVQHVTSSLDTKQPALASADTTETPALHLVKEPLEASNADDAVAVEDAPDADAEVTKLADIGSITPIKAGEEEPTPHNLMALRAYR
jgi:hypothetical protein